MLESVKDSAKFHLARVGMQLTGPIDELAISATEICEAFCKEAIGVRGTKGMLISVADCDANNPLALLQASHATEVQRLYGLLAELAEVGGKTADELHDCKKELADTQTHESLLDRENRRLQAKEERLQALNDNQAEMLKDSHCRYAKLEKAYHAEQVKTAELRAYVRNLLEADMGLVSDKNQRIVELEEEVKMLRNSTRFVEGMIAKEKIGQLENKLRIARTVLDADTVHMKMEGGYPVLSN